MLFLFIHSSMVMFHVVIIISSGSWLMECSDETLSIFWKNAFMKNEEFLKWNSWKNFFFLQPSVFLIFVMRKINVTIKFFAAPPFFNHFSLTLNRKKRVVMAIKKNLNIFTLQVPINIFTLQLPINIFTLQLPIYYILG